MVGSPLGLADGGDAVDHRRDASARGRLLSRRGLIGSLCGAALGCESVASAKSPVARVAVLDPAALSGWQACVDALRERGWVEGRNLAFELRSTEGRPERFRELAAELVALRPDVIIAVSSQSTQAARESTDSIPIVMIGVADPIGSGFVTNLARPGHNITGISNQFRDTGGKMLQLLTEVRPGISRVLLFFVPENSGSRLNEESLVEVAPRLGVTLEPVPVNTPEDLDVALAEVARSRPDALATLSPPLLVLHRQRIIAFALDHRLPAISNYSQWVRDGLLMSYGAEDFAMWRRAADFVDRILKGATPATMPVEQPTKFELAVNLKTANALSLTIPQSILQLADEVVE